MKTVTAKEFQLKSSQMMKEAAKGTVYQVTYHGRPWVELHPGTKPSPRIHAGSPEAFLESLAFTYSDTKLPAKPNYKKIRRQQIAKKYGNQQ